MDGIDRGCLLGLAAGDALGTFEPITGVVASGTIASSPGRGSHRSRPFDHQQRDVVELRHIPGELMELR